MKIETFIKSSPSTLSVLQGLHVQQTAKQSLHKLDLNLNFLQALTLVSIFFEQPTPATVTKIVEATDLSKGNISQIISHLEAEGFIKRTLNAQDQRIWLLNTTKKAGPVVSKIISYFDSVQHKTEKLCTTGQIHTFNTVSDQIPDFHKSGS